MKRIQLLTVITALTAAVGAHAQVPSVTNYTFTTIDNPLGVKGTQLHGISGSNIVGNYYDASNGSHGFLYNGSTYTTIHPPSASLGTGMGGVSGDKIVGSYRDASNIAHGFVYSISTSAYTTFDHPLTIDLTAGTGICGTNIVGYFGYGHQGGEIGATGYNGFLYNGATFTTIDHPLGVNGTIALGIDGNDIVGYWGDAAGHNHGFLYNGPTFTTIDDPLGASDTIVNGISGNTIFGNYTDASGIPHGFVYSISTSAYTTFDRPLGVNGKGVAGISGDKIVGSYWDASGNAHGYLATPISDTATATATMVNGFVVAATISAPGCGYTNAPLVRFIGGGGSGAQAVAVVSNGVVMAVNLLNAGSGYTSTPLVVIPPPFIPNPVLDIAPMSFLVFSNLTLGGVYQLQQLMGWYWSNQPVSFTATNTLYTQMVAGVADNGDYRLALNPVPTQAFATAQVVNGFVVGATVTSGGSGYVTSPGVTTVGGGGTNAAAISHISGGVMTSITITDAGIGYTNAPTLRIAPPPAAAVSPTVLPVMRMDSANLAPYDNYQIQFNSDLSGIWGNWNGGLFSPTGVTNSQYVFITNGVGFFRLQYTP